MNIKKAETKESFQQEAREFVINKKARAHTLHRKNSCSHSAFFTKYIDFGSVEEAINSSEDFAPCKVCFSKENFSIQEDIQSPEDLCNQAVKALYLQRYDVAQRLFERFRQLEPGQPLGYVGLARVTATDDHASISAYCDSMKPAFQMTCAAAYQNAMHKVINFCPRECSITFLSCAACIGDLETVRFLVRMGADVNLKGSICTTALWHVSSRPLKSKVTEKREIAKFLLDHGAEINVWSNCCEDLFNRHTDPQIAAMIRRKYPNAEMGVTPHETDDELPSQSTKLTREEKRIVLGFVAAVIAAIVLIYLIVSGMTGGSKWSDLSDTEKENAKWANDVMEELDDYR